MWSSSLNVHLMYSVHLMNLNLLLELLPESYLLFKILNLIRSDKEGKLLVTSRVVDKLQI